MCLLVGIFAVQNKQLQNKLVVAEERNEELKIEREMAEMKSYFETKPIDSEIVLNYASWVQSKQLAEQLYKDSNGLFQKEWGLFLGELAQKKNIDPYIVYELKPPIGMPGKRVNKRQPEKTKTEPKRKQDVANTGTSSKDSTR